jgi:hypothetical protein
VAALTSSSDRESHSVEDEIESTEPGNTTAAVSAETSSTPSPHQALFHKVRQLSHLHRLLAQLKKRRDAAN